MEIEKVEQNKYNEWITVKNGWCNYISTEFILNKNVRDKNGHKVEKTPIY